MLDLMYAPEELRCLLMLYSWYIRLKLLVYEAVSY
jgi:hypothetical protein